MASITRRGTCVPPGPSKKTAGWPFTICDNEGNWERNQLISKGAFTSVVVDIVLFYVFLVVGYRAHEIGQQAVSRSF